MSPNQNFQCLPASAAAALILSEDKPVVFDVRDVLDYRQGHISDAAHLVESRLMAWFSKLAKDQAIIIYCYRGNASRMFAQMFADFRFTRVFSVDGGYQSLSAAMSENQA